MAKKLRRRGTSGDMLVYRYRGKKKRKKRSRALKGPERAVRRAAIAERAFSTRYLRGHRKSNRKKRDGWLRDLDKNLYKASRRGSKRFKARRVFRF